MSISTKEHVVHKSLARKTPSRNSQEIKCEHAYPDIVGESDVKGVYVLAIIVRKNVEVGVGALGKTDFKKGWYAYVGSAQKGLENRVKRHLTGIRRRNFWHIDYLLDNDFVEVVKAFYEAADKSVECETADKLKKKGVPMAGFGCSDCTCESHLFKIDDYDFLRDFMSEIQLGNGLEVQTLGVSSGLHARHLGSQAM